MQVRKFEAPTIAEALKLVKAELGPEAIILSTKNHRKGFGLLSKASVEVTAAIAEKTLAKKQITERLVPTGTKDRIGKLPAEKQAEIYDEFHGYVTRRRSERDRGRERGGEQPRYVEIGDDGPAATRAVAPETTSVSTAGYASAAGYARNGRPAGAAVAQLRPAAAGAVPVMRPEMPGPVGQDTVSGTDVAALAEDVTRLKSMLEEVRAEQTALSDSRAPEAAGEEIQAEFQNLLRNGIDKRYATALVKQAAFALPRERARDSDAIIEALAVELMGGLKVEHPMDFKAGQDRRVFALVGPTGVGKTTTIAKLASQAILTRNLKVGLINLDSYKVAAVDQLGTYAKILNVPFRQATTAVELDRALTEFKPLDLILIDTSGRSQRDTESLSKMRSMLLENAAVRPLLILSATTRDQELFDIAARFRVFNPTGLIFSKLDESATFGCIYNVSLKTGLPLGYFTVGQRVPEDIEDASKERVASLVLDI